LLPEEDPLDEPPLDPGCEPELLLVPEETPELVLEAPDEPLEPELEVPIDASSGYAPVFGFVPDEEPHPTAQAARPIAARVRGKLNIGALGI
jgi:hypothetical protein